ncbi:MAG: hypothetical protein ACSHW0_00575 [Thalassotalea sp.]
MSIKPLLLSSLMILPLSVLAANAPIIDEQQYLLADIEKLSLSFRHTQITIEYDSSDHISVTHQQTLKKGDAEKCLYQLNEKRRGDQLTISNERADEKSSFFGFSFASNCSVEQKITK